MRNKNYVAVMKNHNAATSAGGGGAVTVLNYNEKPVKKMATAYNEQMLLRQHNSAYATVCQAVQPVETGMTSTSSYLQPIYVNIYPLLHQQLE